MMACHQTVVAQFGPASRPRDPQIPVASNPVVKSNPIGAWGRIIVILIPAVNSIINWNGWTLWHGSKDVPGMAKSTQTVTPRPKIQRKPLFLRQWRKHRGLTQEVLADRAGITQGMVSQLENNESDYTGGLLLVLSDALQCDPVDLIIRDPSDSESLWTIWDQAKPGQRRQITEVAKTLIKTGT